MIEPPPLLLQLLASPRLLRDGELVHVGSRKALAILAWLALEGGSTRARLTGLLWPEADAAAGRRNLRRELFRLREFGLPLCEAVDGTLALDDAGLEVDALRLLADDRLPEGSGLAFDGLDGVGSGELDAWLQRWRDKLAARQAQAFDHQAAALEAGGELAAALALRQRGWAADPLQEAAALHVMRLKAALGDPAGALQAYQRLFDALRDELDIAPSAAVLTFVQSLRDKSTGTAAPPTMPTARASAGPGLPRIVPFVPRAAPQQQIDAAWACGQRVYLHGAAGAGKTRLASELAAARGPWLRVACEPQDAELPYSSVVRLLRALRDSAPDVALPDWVRRELAQLMPELGEPPRSLPTDDARQRLLAAVAEAWRLLMHDNFSAVVLDDWHWGDPASVELWSRLDATNVAGAAPVAWIIGYRSAQLPVAALARQRADLDSGRAVAVALEGLDEAEVLALTRVLSGAPGGRLFSQRLHRATEGNPFFLLETLRHLFEQGLLCADADGWSTPFDDHTESYAELPVPGSVRTAVLARVRALGVSVQRLLEVASLGSGEIDARLLAAVGDLDEERAVAALEHAAAAQLVQETQAGWRFAHDLVRQSLAQGLSPGRRLLLHERLARRLEQEGAPPARIAAHWEAAQMPATAVRWRVAAAESALRVHAVSDALGHYARALADGAEGVAAASIHLACSRLHWRHADRQAADASLAAAAVAVALDPAAGTAERLRVQLARIDHLRLSDRVAASLDLLDALAPEFDHAEPPQRAQAFAARASALVLQGQHQDAQDLLDRALALLEGSPGQHEALGSLLLQAAVTAYRRGDMAGFGKLARRAVAVHEAIDSPTGMSQALSMLGAFLIEGGEHDEAQTLNERGRAVARAAGDVPAHRRSIFNLVKLAFHRNDVEQAGVLLDEGQALAPHFENREIEHKFIAARYYLHRLRGEAEAAKATATRLLDLVARGGGPLERIGYIHLVVDASLLEGDLERSRALIAEAQAICDVQVAGGHGNHYAPQQAVKQARLALAEGRPKDALVALPPETALSVAGDRFGRAWIGCAAALALGDIAQAERHLGLVDRATDVDNGTLALWLEQRLALDAASGKSDGTALRHAENLLRERRVPVMVAERLQRAVAAARPPD